MKTIADYRIEGTLQRLRVQARANRSTAADVYGNDAAEAGKLVRIAERMESLADEIEREQ
ncbi:hypothetical protein [Chromohalobacter moromii]|uniref:Uncharacterized protein n=1 Tax=Chromohalobacter moromii TaxID=2860329 RepID=A0A9X2X430_9GAMM|nr:hypothetical protein [Chromohalobacter moromii]MCK2046990.1 hypothetical protein [Chromohalobacter moromii]MCT8506567.1 hypothetical protein [Chromohalobacter moromii]